eukprot:CAMPEP_0170819404 /NCGR_PEP_ID=MMETSP0733-20121128/41515_1 /TAXON_ID=186038 /ORGANISM="Fragilariopsis kerguelensis, Strain L26-C5" /LENGTH=530 /DNA_ID=CAMNT_0011180109 /DNA_START=102 /DNA_END=1694 /DNA_ORIENTATION=-
MNVAEAVNLDKQQLLDLRQEQYCVPDRVDLDDEYIRNIQKKVSETFIKDRDLYDEFIRRQPTLGEGRFGKVFSVKRGDFDVEHAIKITRLSGDTKKCYNMKKKMLTEEFDHHHKVSTHSNIVTCVSMWTFICKIEEKSDNVVPSPSHSLSSVSQPPMPYLTSTAFSSPIAQFDPTEKYSSDVASEEGENFGHWSSSSASSSSSISTHVSSSSAPASGASLPKAPASSSSSTNESLGKIASEGEQISSEEEALEVAPSLSSTETSGNLTLVKDQYAPTEDVSITKVTEIPLAAEVTKDNLVTKDAPTEESHVVEVSEDARVTEDAVTVDTVFQDAVAVFTLTKSVSSSLVNPMGSLSLAEEETKPDGISLGVASLVDLSKDLSIEEQQGEVVPLTPFINTDIYQGVFMIQLEQVNGKNFKHILEDGEYGLSQRLEWYLQVLDGVKFMHRERIIHCDLKPANIMIDINTMQAKIVDFGMSQSLGDDQDFFTLSKGGTTLYHSPEQSSGENFTFTAEIFALGSILIDIYVSTF